MSHADDDAVLVARASSGDADAIEEIYRRHRDWVAALAYRFTNDRGEALDVLQDAFAYFLSKKERRGAFSVGRRGAFSVV